MKPNIRSKAQGRGDEIKAKKTVIELIRSKVSSLKRRTG